MLSEHNLIQHQYYRRVEKAIHFMVERQQQQPSLAEIASYVGVSDHHFQRIFSEWAGVSPKRFMQFLTKEHAKAMLREAESVNQVAYEVGLSGSGRLHDLMVSCEAMTPGEIKQQGAELLIEYGYAMTPFGFAMLACTERGLCHLMFNDDMVQAQADLRANWPQASFNQVQAQADVYVQRIFTGGYSGKPLHLLLKGTNFQIKVWEALIRLQPGQMLSYGQLAQRLDMPKAARAVGSAVGANNIGFLIPCHRVIRESGELSNYRWGTERKAMIQGWEAAKRAL